MKPFLSQVAELFYNQEKKNIHQLAFVFPNHRAGLFFKRYLAQIVGEPIFSPTILTINELLIKLSGLQSADHIGMLFKLYSIFRSINKNNGETDESFDDFLFWGDMLLNDFNDVDKYLVNAKSLFTNVTNLRQIKDDFSYLSEEQLRAIQTFWESFNIGKDTDAEKKFLQLWEILYDVYSEFRSQLLVEGKGYEGMIFRSVVDKIKNDENLDLPYNKIVFIGLNALSLSEEKFLEALQKMGKADFYWDYDSPYVNDENNKASFFAKRNKEKFPSLHELPQEELPREPKIETIGIPSSIGQAKLLPELLKSLCESEGDKEKEAFRTAIVLPDEHLLIPVLNSIPQDIKHINVTMGYPLSSTPIASLMNTILTMQKNIILQDGKPMFYHRDVLPILNHRDISQALPELTSNLVSHIIKFNRVRIGAEELKGDTLLEKIFSPISDAAELSDYLIDILEAVSALNKENLLEEEFIFSYYKTVNRMREVMKNANIMMTVDTYRRLLERMAALVSIPFLGEPLSGLQIMGVLETRALDFDRVIILSMNEGFFPMHKPTSTFVPYNLRKGFDLPTYEHQDSVWAYHFYRLIHRASQISIVYDTRTEGVNRGEKSRYINQLQFDYQTSMTQKLVTYNVCLSNANKIAVEKDEKVLAQLYEYIYDGNEGGKALSASAINTYITCPLQFYFANVKNFNDADEVSERIEADVFGTIFHEVMRKLYDPYCGRIVPADVIDRMMKDETGLTFVIEQAFSTKYFNFDKLEKPRQLTGENYLCGELVRRYVKKFLEFDKTLPLLKYVASEFPIHDKLTLSDGRFVRIKGVIDRIDEVDGQLRIIDYKTGSDKADFKQIEDFFNATKSYSERPHAIMQVFLYAWLYGQKNTGRSISPGIYSVRDVFKSSFNPIVRANSEEVTDHRPFLEQFIAALTACLDEIFDPNRPFVQTDLAANCNYCQFKDICGRTEIHY